MRENTRANVAYIAARLVLGDEASAVFDYSRGELLEIDGIVNAHCIETHERNGACCVHGRGENGTFCLFYSDERRPIDLAIDGREFEGFDHATTCHFAGEVSGHSVRFFDYGDGAHFSYSVKTETSVAAC
jgi:hypothetical protein